MKSIAVTGRRPAYLPWGYDEGDTRAVALKNRLKYTISGLIDDGYTTFYVGMAEGVDTYIVEILLMLKMHYGYSNISIQAVIPFREFCARWSQSSRDRYYMLLGLVDRVITMSETYDERAIFMRNKYMVDNSDMVLAVYDNIKNGGTYNTLMYARSIGKDVRVEEI